MILKDEAQEGDSGGKKVEKNAELASTHHLSVVGRKIRAKFMNTKKMMRVIKCYHARLRAKKEQACLN